MYSRFTFINNITGNSQKSQEPSFWQVMNSFILLTNASLAASRTLLQQLLVCLNLTLDWRLILLAQTKNCFLWTIAAAQVAENHKVKWGLTWYLWGIYTSIPTWMQSQNLLAAAEALSSQISYHWSSQIIKKTVPNSTRIVKLCNETRYPTAIWWKLRLRKRETEKTWWEFPNEHKAIVEQMLESEEKQNKTTGLRESKSGIQAGKLNMWVRSIEFTRFISSTIRSASPPVLLM